jgi:hypothetical protein
MSAAQILLSPGVLGMMIKDSKFRNAFPFLRNARMQLASAGCRSCGRVTANQQYDWNSLKRSIVGLTADRKRLLLTMLDTRKLKVYYRKNPRGKMITLHITR